MTQHTYDVRCHDKGRICSFHGHRVRAASPRAAFAKVVNPTHFGPLHRTRLNSPERVANVKTPVQVDGLPPNRGHMDVRHGAVYVRQVGELA